jgi:Ca2+-binding RTX toxin-like protein
MGDVTTVNAFLFTPDSDVSFELYDSPGGSLLAGPATMKTDGSGGAVYNRLPPIRVGNEVRATDVATGIVKSLVVLSLSVDAVDLDADTVSGTATAGSSVSVNATQPDGSVPNVTTTADSSGKWIADFGADHIDLTGSTGIGAWIFDSDGDKTTTAPRPGCPATQMGWFWDCSIHASLQTDGVMVNWASANSEIQFEVLDSAGHTIWGPVRERTNEHGDVAAQLLGFDSGVDLVAGDRIVMTDLATSTVKTLDLEPLAIESVDPETDVVSGTAPPNASVDVAAQTSLDFGPTAVTTVADASGHWSLNFKQAAHHDITDVDAVSAFVFDPDGDVTMDALGTPLKDCSAGADTVCGTAGPDSIRPTGGAAAATTSSSLEPGLRVTASATRIAARTRTVHAGPGDDIVLATATRDLRQLRLDVGTGALDRVVVRAGPKLPKRSSLPHVVVSGKSRSMFVVLPAHAGNLVVEVIGARGADSVSTRKLGGKGFSAGGYRIFGKGGNDKLTGGDGSDRIDGGGGNDLLKGGRGNDVLIGGSGKDTLIGGPGRDTCYKGPGDRLESCEVVRRLK